jgi:carboxyl-terminal processing protease
VVAETLTGTNIGYIMVSMFGENTDKEFSKELNTLMEKNMSGIIVDLRDNGGGILDVAINMLGRLVEKDKALVITKENDIKNTHTYFSEGINPIKTPIVVLVNENSASASEIVAGALKDYKKAVLIGKKTYGK